MAERPSSGRAADLELANGVAGVEKRDGLLVFFLRGFPSFLGVFVFFGRFY